LAHALVFVFGEIFLDEVIEFVGLGSEAWSGKGALLPSLLFVVGKYLIETALLDNIVVFIAMATLQALVLRLTQGVRIQLQPIVRFCTAYLWLRLGSLPKLFADQLQILFV
jgi:hypothetical protein